ADDRHVGRDPLVRVTVEALVDTDAVGAGDVHRVDRDDRGEEQLVVQVVRGRLRADVPDGQVVHDLPLTVTDRAGRDEGLVQGRLARPHALVVRALQAVPPDRGGVVQ